MYLLENPSVRTSVDTQIFKHEQACLQCLLRSISLFSITFYFKKNILDLLCTSVSQTEDLWSSNNDLSPSKEQTECTFKAYHFVLCIDFSLLVCLE
jgi:predicted Zn-dependent protease